MTTSTKRPDSDPAPETKRMRTSTKWLIGLLGTAGLILVVGLVLALLSLLPLQREVDGGAGSPEPTPSPVPIPDGDWFAFVTVGRDESDTITLGIDLAEMLTGQAAHDAAVKAGVITEDEELPNDFFIDNPESVLELAHLSDTAVIEVLSSDDVTRHFVVDATELEDLYEGDYVGAGVYGIAPGQPIAMDVTIALGKISRLSAVYLP